MKIFEGMHKYIWLEWGVWFLILCCTVAGIRFHHYQKEKKLITYQIFMPDVDGMIAGSPVKLMGVQIGYIEKIKIVSDNVYLKIVITKQGVTIPKGSVATVEFNGMGGSKSLEVYPPTEESLTSNRLIVVQSPKRLNDAMGLLSDMFDKIGSITTKLSFFAEETNMDKLNSGVDVGQIQTNMGIFDRLMKETSDIMNNHKGAENEKRESDK